MMLKLNQLYLVDQNMKLNLRRTFTLLKISLCISGSAHASILLEDLNHATISFDDLKGKWVFINYWASWCTPCVEEISAFNRFYTQHKTEPIAVFAVQFDAQSIAKQREQAQNAHIQYPSLLPRSVKSLHLGAISVVPVTFVFNPQGNLHTTLYGGQTLPELNKVISEHGLVPQLKSHA